MNEGGLVAVAAVMDCEMDCEMECEMDCENERRGGWNREVSPAWDLGETWQWSSPWLLGRIAVVR